MIKKFDKINKIVLMVGLKKDKAALGKKIASNIIAYVLVYFVTFAADSLQNGAFSMKGIIGKVLLYGVGIAFAVLGGEYMWKNHSAIDFR